MRTAFAFVRFAVRFRARGAGLKSQYCVGKWFLNTTVQRRDVKGKNAQSKNRKGIVVRVKFD